MQETCRRSTDLAMPSNIRLENKIGNPRTLRKKSEIKTKNRSIGVESDLDSIGVQWPGDRGFSQVEILFFLFYIYTIIFSKSEIAAKKIVAKYKHKPSRTLHGRKAGEKRFHAKTVLKNIKSRFSNKKC